MAASGPVGSRSVSTKCQNRVARTESRQGGEGRVELVEPESRERRAAGELQDGHRAPFYAGPARLPV